MSTMPGAVVIPAKYGEAMVLFSAVNKVECVVDGAPVGKHGRLFKVETGKPVKVPYEAGRFILEHMGYLGVVRVLETETDTGIEYDVEGAKAESLALTAEQDEERFHRYIQSAVDDFVKRGKPVPQPDPAMMEILERRGYDLKRYGIVPIGWEKPEDAKVTAIQSENADLKKTLEAMQRQLDAFVAGQTSQSEGKPKKG